MPKNEQMTKWKNSRCILKMLFFHCHVSFREGCVIARPNPDSALKEKALEMNYQRMKKNISGINISHQWKTKTHLQAWKGICFLGWIWFVMLQNSPPKTSHHFCQKSMFMLKVLKFWWWVGLCWTAVFECTAEPFSNVKWGKLLWKQLTFISIS